MDKKYHFKLNDHKYSWSEKEISGENLLLHVGLTPTENYELLLKLSKREFEPIQLNEIIHLDDPGVEQLLAKPYKSFSIIVDDEPIILGVCFITPKEILVKAGYDPEKFYLKQIIGNKDITYKEDPEHRISVKNGMKFSTCKIGAVTVS